MRLPNGFGSVYKLSGKRRKPYVARKTIGWSFDEVKKKSYPVYQFIGYYTTRKEALTALSEFNKDPYDLHSETITFLEVYERWSEKHFETISESNIKAYKSAFKVCKPIEDMKISEMKLDHVQKVINESGKNEPMLRKVKSIVSQCFEYAVIHEIIPKERADVMEYLDVKKGNPNKIQRSSFTEEEIKTIWKHVDEKETKILLIMIYSGVRVSELLNLKKEDVHLDERWFFVGKAKTDAGIREVPIAEKIVPLVQYWLSLDSEYLISEKGNRIDYKRYKQKIWDRHMEHLGMNHSPHDTRHTCISMLTVSGVDDRIIKKIVGHKGYTITESVYTHIDLKPKLEAINRI